MEMAQKAFSQQLNATHAQMQKDGTMSSIIDAHGKAYDSSESYRQSFASNLTEAIKNSKGLSDATQTKLMGGAGFNFIVRGGAEIDTTSQAFKSLSKDEQTALVNAHEKATLKTMSENQSITRQFTKTETLENSSTYQALLNSADTYSQAKTSMQSVEGNTLNNIINGLARENAANAGVADFNSLSTSEQNRYFADAGATVNSMAQNDRASLLALNKQYGGGMISQGSFGTTGVENKTLGSNANPYIANGRNEATVNGKDYGTLPNIDVCQRIL